MPDIKTLAPIVAQLLTTFLPVIRQITEELKASGTAVPTDEQIIAKFNADIDKYLREGAEWKARHPQA